MESRRNLAPYMKLDLPERMVFIGGPRQVGKTTLARDQLTEGFQRREYFNWDEPTHRKRILHQDWRPDTEVIILDEVHKYKRWKNHVKGIYDTQKDRHHFIVTGSARLDVYRKGGDSMLGRYRYYRLHPFSMAECLGKTAYPAIFKPLEIESKPEGELTRTLFRFGGFPEPLFKANDRFLRRWHVDKTERLFREDIRDVEVIRDLSLAQTLQTLLPGRVGSLLSLNSLREDLEVSHRAVTSWMNILETFYYLFRIRPFAVNHIRSLKKETKLYLWDWSEVEDPGARFENMIASHLLKLAHFLRDVEGLRTEVCYLRDTGKREVDFLFLVDQKPWFAVEAKVNDTSIASSLLYFQKKANIPFVYQVIQKPGVYKSAGDNAFIVSAEYFLTTLV